MAHAPEDVVKGLDVPDEVKPKFLNEEQMHHKYSVEACMKDYANNVYYRQRKGGDSWFHGRVSDAYREGYDQINWRK